MDRNSKTAILYITDNGLALAQRLAGLYPDAAIVKFRPEIVPQLWREKRDLIFIMATGIVVRTIAPLIKDKKTDPAVIVLDEKGEFAISLLSGHLGGANDRAREIADFLGGKAVITTASDVNNFISIDLWAEENGLIIGDWDIVPQIGVRLLNNGALRIFIEQKTEDGIQLPEEFLRVSDPRFADILVTFRKDIYLNGPACISGQQCPSGACHVKGQLYLRPKNLVIGIGCNSGTSSTEIKDAVRKVFSENNLAFHSIHSVATIDKKGREPGLLDFVGKYGFDLNTFTADELNSIGGISKSEAAFRATGANAVAEPAALLAANTGILLVPKQKLGNVTIAVAELKSEGRAQGTEHRHGKIYIVGTGPGSVEHITPYALKALRESDVIVGYGTYLDLIQELLGDKEVVSTGMTQEIDRCNKAVELAASGRTVSVISGGDPGIYAMAGLVFEVLKKSDAYLNSELRTVSVEVIPGISALNACAARLGAPLMHDFASISLSDRLTPWELIEKRLDAAAMADFVIALYNPKSKGRAGHIGRARDIILRHRAPDTPVGIVKGAMRENEKIVITDLQDMLQHDIDMQTTVIIGNSQTFVWDKWLVTPRGYGVDKDKKSG